MNAALQEAVATSYIDLKMGVSWYSGIPESASGLSDLWLPNESFDVVDQLKASGGVTLIGGTGSGKSAILYGARAVMRVHGIPYVTINGHYKNTPPEQVVDVIDAAQEQDLTIVYDSADYLVGGHRRARAMPWEKHLERNLAIMQKLIEFRRNGGRLLMTSHNDTWIDDTAHPNLLPTWHELVNLTTQQQVNIRLETFQERARFLTKVGVDLQSAEFLARLPENERFLNFIVKKWGDKRYLTYIQQALSNYAILKLMGRDNYGENAGLIEAVRKVLVDEAAEELSWDEIVNFIYSKFYLLTFFTRK